MLSKPPSQQASLPAAGPEQAAGRHTSARKHIPSELLIVFAAFGLAIVSALVSLALQLGAPDGPPLSVRAYGVTGSVALARWAESLGYRSKVVEGRPFRIPGDLQLLFVLQPAAQYALGIADRDALLRWVSDGGTLVLALENEVSYPVTRRGPLQLAQGDTSVFEAFNLDLSPILSSSTMATLTLQQPFLTQPVVGSFAVPLQNSITIPDDAITLASLDGQAVIASRRLGKGWVIALSTTYPFTNEGLRDENNAHLVLNLLRLAPAGGTIGFDEYHHGSRQTASLLAWLVTAPAGQAILLALALLAGYIVWSGRRFGRAVTLPEMRVRRQPSEYIVAMANLARTARQREATLRRYHDGLKRKLGQPRRIDPNLADEDFVAELSAIDPDVNAEKLRQLLRALSSGTRRLSVEQFVALARDASEFE